MTIRLMRSDGTQLLLFNPCMLVGPESYEMDYFSYTFTHNPGSTSYYYYLQMGHASGTSTFNFKSSLRSINLIAVKK